jgi:ZIP family zinc transporter
MAGESLGFALLLATIAGATIPLGGLLASFPRLVPRWIEAEFRHSVIAFGGGALLAAVALVLIPVGAERVHPGAALALFAAGGIVFLLIDRAIAQRGGHGAQFMAMMLDFLPESLALGALLAGAPEVAVLLAILIGLQNLPEGFNAFREISESGTMSRRRILALFVATAALGPVMAVVGLVALQDGQAVLGGIMLFAAGGILYLIFQDIAPQVPLERHWGPPLGAVAGFLLGFAGDLALG